MKPVLQFLPSKDMANASCVYNAADMSIQCEILVPSAEQPRQTLAESLDKQFYLERRSDLLLIADTLTLTFSGSDHQLSGLDAYSNKNTWKVSKTRELPSIEGRGFLVVDPASFKHGRLALDLTPLYEQSRHQEWVRIVFREDETASHFEVAKNLMAGLKDGMVTDIYLLKVNFL